MHSGLFEESLEDKVVRQSNNEHATTQNKCRVIIDMVISSQMQKNKDYPFIEESKDIFWARVVSSIAHDGGGNHILNSNDITLDKS